MFTVTRNRSEPRDTQRIKSLQKDYGISANKCATFESFLALLISLLRDNVRSVVFIYNIFLAFTVADFGYS
jgi:hypothetical protein